MVRRICPICDRVMKTPHYCTTCRSWVKEPYIREVTYYLNERHPNFETDCDYHGGDAQTSAQRTEGIPERKKEPAEPKRKTPESRVPGTGRRQSQSRPEQTAGNSGWIRTDSGKRSDVLPDASDRQAERSKQERERNRNRQVGGMTAFFILMVILVVLNIARVIVSLGWGLIRSLSNGMFSIGFETEWDPERVSAEGEEQPLYVEIDWDMAMGDFYDRQDIFLSLEQ